jgi:dipeptidyl aminopeptidase/acylaminoacyl peptidase
MIKHTTAADMRFFGRPNALSLLYLLLLAFSPAWGQGTKADYDRAASLADLTRGKVFRDRVEAHWFNDSRQMWYKVRTGPREWVFILVTVSKDGNRRGPAFDHQRLAIALREKKLADVPPKRLPIESLDFDAAGKYVDLAISGRWWRCDLKSYELSPRPGAAPVARAPRSRLRPWAGAPRASNETGEETTVTFVNRTSGAVELFWLDTDGKRQSYGRLRPGDERSQHTFAGHVWLVSDAQGRPLGVTVAEDSDATVEIRDKEAAENKTPQSPPQSSLDDDDASMEPPQAQTARQRRRSPRRASSPRSPDGHWEAFLKDHNVYVRDSKGEEIALSRNGTTEDDYGPRFYWSPDSRKLLAVRTKHCDERKVYFIESSPRDQVQPKLHSNTYVKPGDPLPIDRPQLFDLPTKKPVKLDRSLYENPWSVGDFRWAADSSRFTFVFNQRGHQDLRLLAVDAATGAVRPIIDEHSPTFIDYSGKFFLHYVDGASELIWMSERDGWNHLYLYDGNTGRVKNQITKGRWVVRGVDRVDEAKRQVWFRASGIHRNQDPYYIHYCRVNFDGSGLTVLTKGDGTHKIDFSPDGKTFIDSYSRVDMPPVTELRSSEDGTLVSSLEKGTMDLLLRGGWQMPERFVAKGRDGETDIYGVIFRPANFDAKKRYPVIEQIYAGPQDSFVPKNFHAFYPHQEMAELGFIVVQIDGMGTSNRSKKFHDVCWKNLADSGLPDRILWIRAAAKRYPYMDTSRVGIYGGSAGGQSAAAAVMTHGDFYKVAVADCGCHDNRMDKIWWNEQWMGWPVGPEYRANSNVTLAPGLKGKLLLIVGELDTNVDPASTMQVVDALIRADKDFELLVVPGSNHGAAESPYGRRRRADFFVRNLLGVEPRW